MTTIQIQLAPIQQRIIAQTQHDEGYLAHLQREIEAVKDRLAANRGKLDLLAELAQQAGGPSASEQVQEG